ncbi:hypothetical protein GLX27_000773 [Malassezia furfur]|uniref:Signal peptidase complex subunit 1 n=1 Tax=Malassezia furfur TaxID=55194 RepID=A0ABY8EMC7_MALFU|nr:hypothetical protein GLX27_000773 [Malassezia furfur]
MEALSQSGKIDYCGQQLAERLYQYVLITGAVIAFVAGYLREDLALTLYIFLAFAVVCLGLCVPPWPMYNRYHVAWRPSS